MTPAEQGPKHIALLQYRGGSTLYQKLMTTQDKVPRLPIVGPGVYRVEVGGLLEPPASEPDIGVEWRVWHGDWWGQCPSSGVPRPYDIVTPASWQPGFIESLIAVGWKIVAIVRDGRDQIESTRCFKGGIEEQRQGSNPSDYFTYLCKAFRNKARVILDSWRLYSDSYTIVRMEDLLTQPEETLGRLGHFLGLELDWDAISHNIEFARTNMSSPGGLKQRHSSFSNNNFIGRSVGWSRAEMLEFERIAGPEQSELGYSVT